MILMRLPDKIPGLSSLVPRRTRLSSHSGTPVMFFGFYLLNLQTNHVYHLLQEESTQRSMVF
jgi:hypothetical protein